MSDLGDSDRVSDFRALAQIIRIGEGGGPSLARLMRLVDRYATSAVAVTRTVSTTMQRHRAIAARRRARCRLETELGKWVICP